MEPQTGQKLSFFPLLVIFGKSSMSRRKLFAFKNKDFFIAIAAFRATVNTNLYTNSNYLLTDTSGLVEA